MEKIKGKIKAISKNRKGVKIGEVWYNFYYPILSSFSEGNEVTIEYKVVTKKDKTYTNGYKTSKEGSNTEELDYYEIGKRVVELVKNSNDVEAFL